MRLPALILTSLMASSTVLSAADRNARLQNWPYWRGPLGTGVAPSAQPPLEWSRSENVRWRFADPGLGFSSPIIWQDKVFFTTAIESPDPGSALEPEQRGMFGAQNPVNPREFVLIAVDRESGTELWRRVARRTVPHEGHHRTLSSYANISPVTDGERVFASFGSYGLYAYDFDGEPLWERDFGVRMKMFNRFGESSSPALHGNTLVLNFDQEEQSFVVAVDKRSGEILWRQERDEETTWTSPFIIESGGTPQVVVNGTNFVRSYDLSTGEVLWKVSGMTKAPIPAPVHGHGMVFLASGTNGQAFKAVRLGGSGDLTGTGAEIWSLNKGVPYNPTPLLWGDEIYLLKDPMSGSTFASAFDARTGKEHYLNARLPESWTIRASAVGAADRIYIGSEEGDVIVLRRGTELEVLAVNSMDEMILATPAIADGDLILRTRSALYRIAEND